MRVHSDSGFAKRSEHRERRVQSDRDVLGRCAGRGDGISVCAHTIQVKLNRFVNEFFYLIQRFARSAKPRQVGSIRAPPRVRFFVDD